MQNEEIVNKIAKTIKAQKSYKPLYLGTIVNVVRQEVVKRDGEITGIISSGNAKRLKKIEKEIEVRAINILHQVWDAYFGTRPHWDKLLELATGSDDKSLDLAMKYHASTRERLDIYPDFYKKIFSITGVPKTILDVACGFNPLSYKYMNLSAGSKYFASDIDEEEISFLDHVTKNGSSQVEFHFTCKDLLVDDFETIDVALLFKVLQPLEQQKKGSAAEVMRKINAKWFVITFPTKSLSGKQKGMVDYYGNWFETNIAPLMQVVMPLTFDSELVFVCRKKS